MALTRVPPLRPEERAPVPSNLEVAQRLREAADLLELQGAQPFRVAAYRRAADTVADLDDDVLELARREGLKGLVQLPGIGRGIGGAITEMAATGRLSRLERLRGELDPVRRLQSVPGIGPALAERIHDQLHVDSLEGLEAAAHDGRLASVPGLGERRVSAIRATLGTMLRRWRPHRPRPSAPPAVGLLLDVDREYRERAEAGDLPTIAPKRFNPQQRAWLPILHTDRERWHFTALFSNTARAHELGRVRDWVVIYFYDDDHEEDQSTVVTEHRGALTGRRVIRGRETECRRHYEGADELGA